MKTILTILIFITFTCLGYIADRHIVEYVLSITPKTEWVLIIELLLWTFVIPVTVSVVFWLSALIVLIFLDTDNFFSETEDEDFQ